MIGILFRVIRVVLGSLLYLGLMSIYLIGYAVWLAWPLICLWAFLGYFLGLNPQDLGSTNSTPTQEVISDF